MADHTEVRRPLTTVFVDLVGSTPLSIALDGEEYAAFLGEYRDISRRVAEDHGGFIPRDEGDGRFFWFGWPTAERDDAHRAIEMTQALMQAVEPLNERMQRRHGRGVELRVGVHTGSAIIATEGDQDFADVAGAAINLAAKVQGKARPGEVLISEATEEAVRGRWELADAGALTVDSLDGEIALRRVVAPAATEPGDSEPIFARETELARLRQATSRPLAIIGAAGMGKSRLVVEFANRSSSDVMVIQGAERRATMPFAPLLDALRAREDHAVEPMDPDDPAGSVVERFRTLAAHGPIVLVIEDVHWLDPSSVEVIERLVERGDPTLRMIFTARWMPDLRCRGMVDVLELRPLSAEDARSLVRSIADEISDDLVAGLAERSDGNPFFLTWLARAAGSRFEGVRRILRPRSGVPIVVQQAVRSQIDGAGVSDEVVCAAAIVGLDFDPSIVSRSIDRSIESVGADLQRLCDHGIIEMKGPERYRFAHSLVHELAYDLMLGPERRSRHNAVADVLEQVTPNDHATIGFHHDHAGNHALAVEHKLQAAKVCRRSNAYREASILTGRMVELIEDSSDLPAEVVLEVRELHAVVSTSVERDGYVRNTSDATGVLELLDPERDAAMIAIVKTRDWTAAMATADLAAAQRLNFEVYKVAQRTFPAIGPYNTNARALLASLIGRHAHAEQLFERSAEQMLQRGLDPVLGENWATVDDPIVLGLSYTVPTLDVRGRRTSALARLDLAFRRAETLPSGGPTLAHLAHNAATFHQARGDAEAALQAADLVVEIAEDLGLPIWEHQGQLHRRVALAMRAPSPEALTGLKGDADLVAALAAMAAPHFYLVAARLAFEIGEHELFDECLSAIEALSTKRRLRHLDPEVGRLRAARSDDPIEHLRSVWNVADRRGARRYALRALSDLVGLDATVTMGPIDAGGALAAAIDAFPEQGGDPDVERARALLA